ncbi:MAG: 16S rRNA (cytosine(1402)-N(4))-methyltransferase RsmH [Traorella sp.]
MKHVSVLLNECIEGLNIKSDGIYVDGTLGRGGHSSEILKRIPNGQLICFDKDEQAIIESRPRLLEIGKNVIFIHNGFKHLKEELQLLGIHKIDGLLLDLGVSSPQFDEASRGFSYRFDAYLDMRMDQSQELSAYEVVNHYSFEELCRVFSRYGEDPFAKQIARKIEQRRMEAPIQTTFELVDIIKSAYPAKVLNKKGHPAKKIFQAIRIEVNDELHELEICLEEACDLLNVNGRICVISFHSLEDRIVKDTFKRKSSAPKIDSRIPLKADEIQSADFKLINRKPILASEIELEENNRSHSAKLRILERVK